MQYDPERCESRSHASPFWRHCGIWVTCKLVPRPPLDKRSGNEIRFLVASSLDCIILNVWCKFVVRFLRLSCRKSKGILFVCTTASPRFQLLHASIWVMWFVKVYPQIFWNSACLLKGKHVLRLKLKYMHSFQKKKGIKMLSSQFFIPCFLSEEFWWKKKTIHNSSQGRVCFDFIFVVSILFNSGLFSAFILHQDCINKPWQFGSQDTYIVLALLIYFKRQNSIATWSFRSRSGGPFVP